jgi:hypothetical protein
MWTLAEVAAHDGTVWLPIGPEEFEDSISHGAGLGERQVVRAIQTLEVLDELEVRTWKDGRAEKNIYRLIVGPLRAKAVNYDRPELRHMGLTELFWTVDELLLPRAERPRQRTRPGPAKGSISTLRPTDTLSVGQGEVSGADQLTSPPALTDISGADQLTERSVPRARGPFKPPLLNRHEPSEQQQDQTLKPGLPTSVAQDVEARSGSGEPAAASESETEPSSIERAVSEISKLVGWDDRSIDVVGPLLYSLPGEVAMVVLAETLGRKNRRNDVGYFIHLLRVKIPEWRRAQEEARLAAWDAFFGEAGIERVKHEEPERYVLAFARPDLAGARPIAPNMVLKHIWAYLFDYVPDHVERLRLVHVFMHELDENTRQHHASGLAYSDIKNAILSSLTARPVRAYEHVRGFIETCSTDQPPERVAELLAFADELHAGMLAELGEDGLRAEIERGEQAA